MAISYAWLCSSAGNNFEGANHCPKRKDSLQGGGMASSADNSLPPMSPLLSDGHGWPRTTITGTRARSAQGMAAYLY
jgi:hypothetical protein